MNTAAPSTPAKRSHSFHAALLTLLTLFMTVPGIWNLPVIDRDEARFAVASVQMAESGDYVSIRFQDEARNKKPAAAYWAQSAMIKAVPALGEEGLSDYGKLPKADAKAKAEGVISAYPIKDFYLTNPIARASATMQQCSAELLHGEELAEAAE